MTPYLFSKAPNEVSAVRAEGGLTQKRRHEFVRVDLKQKNRKIIKGVPKKFINAKCQMPNSTI